MYLGYQGDKIKYYTQNELDPETWNVDRSEYTEDEYVKSDDQLEWVKKDAEWEAQQTAKRQAAFEDEFLSTSLGNYRLVPKGYANAQQSIDTVDRLVNYSGGLNGELLENVIFYETPDFTKPEECTEEWLVAHQYNPQPMTLQEWAAFYVEFSKKYAAKKYQQALSAINEEE